MKLIICQIRHELSVTIHEIALVEKKVLDGGPYITFVEISRSRRSVVGSVLAY